MRILLQRVLKASVVIEKKKEGIISNGLLVFIAFCNEDNIEDIKWAIKKTLNLRIFNDKNGRMNNSLLNENAEILIVSQFTLFANIKKGNRPSWNKATSPKEAEFLYHEFINEFKMSYKTKKIQTGIFGADMQVKLINDGPVTILFDSKEDL